MGLLLKVSLVGLLAAITSAQQCTTTPGHDISQDNIASYNYKGEGECCGICAGHGGCQGWAWNNYEGGTCWLKGANGPLVPADGVTAGSLGGGGGGNLVEYGEFASAVTGNGYGYPSQAQYDAYIQGLPKGGISSKQEAAMALTHFMWESDGLVAKREYACAETGCPGSYETPGCDAAGQDYYGRGYIQLSWCYNYQPASYYLFGDDRLVWDPDQVARDENTAWNTAFWFWFASVHNQGGVAEGMFGVTTRAINGGLECDGAHQDTARHRYEMYKIVRRAFSLPGDGDERGCYN